MSRAAKNQGDSDSGAENILPFTDQIGSVSRLSDSVFRFGLVIWITMPDRAHTKVQELREMAARLLALALTASEEGDVELLEQFVAAALECEDKASTLEAAASSPKRNKARPFCD